MSNVFKMSLVVAVFLTGCSVKTIDNEYDKNKNTQEEVKVEVVEDNRVDEKIDSITAIDNSPISSETNAQDVTTSSSLEGNLGKVYFEFDRFNISTSMAPVVSDNANLIKSSNLDNSIKLEGNCDEWGSDEYNYALGLKRAKATKEGLLANGIPQDRIELVSFGESNPSCVGSKHDKNCTQQNRRVEFKVLP
jgi:peptidoglycan-associated lipoprotein